MWVNFNLYPLHHYRSHRLLKTFVWIETNYFSLQAKTDQIPFKPDITTLHEKLTERYYQLMSVQSSTEFRRAVDNKSARKTIFKQIFTFSV